PPHARASRQRGAPASQPPATLARAPARPAPIRHGERKTGPKRLGRPPRGDRIRHHPATVARLRPTPPQPPNTARHRRPPAKEAWGCKDSVTPVNRPIRNPDLSLAPYRSVVPQFAAWLARLERPRHLH